MNAKLVVVFFLVPMVALSQERITLEDVEQRIAQNAAERTAVELLIHSLEETAEGVNNEPIGFACGDTFVTFVGNRLVNEEWEAFSMITLKKTDIGRITKAISNTVGTVVARDMNAWSFFSFPESIRRRLIECVN